MAGISFTISTTVIGIQQTTSFRFTLHIQKKSRWAKLQSWANNLKSSSSLHGKPSGT